jgi:hypothetical protein
MSPLPHSSSPEGNGAGPASPSPDRTLPGPAHRVWLGGVPAGPDHPAAGGGGGRGDRPVLLCGVGHQPVRPGRPGRLQLVAGRGGPGGGRWAGHLRDVPHCQPLAPGASGAGYGWLLVGCGTLASIGGNVAHARPNLVAQATAAAIPLAVLAMLEGPKGDAGEVTRLAAQAADGNCMGALLRPAQGPQPSTVRRTDPTADLNRAAAALDSQRRTLPPGRDRLIPPPSEPGCKPPLPSRGRTDRPGRPAP